MSTKSSPAREARKSIPSTMRAAAIDKFGPPEVLKIHNLPVPKVAAKEVLIAVHATVVGIWDTDFRRSRLFIFVPCTQPPMLKNHPC